MYLLKKIDFFENFKLIQNMLKLHLIETICETISK